MGLEFVCALMDMVGQSPYCKSIYLAKFLNCWNNTILGRIWLKEHLIKLKIPQPVPSPLSQKAENCNSFYLTVSTVVHLSIKLWLTRTCGFYAASTETVAYLNPHDSVQWPRVNRYGLKYFLGIFLDSVGVLHDRLLEKSMTLISTV